MNHNLVDDNDPIWTWIIVIIILAIIGLATVIHQLIKFINYLLELMN